jgi:cell division protein FtsA
MNINEPYLFISINEEEIYFFSIKFSEGLHYKILDSTFVKSHGVDNGKIINIEVLSNLIKNNLILIEKKIGFTFHNATLINDQDNFDCINVSGFKKLHGTQVLDKDISYILNNIKKIIVENEPQSSIIHLLNSDFILDNISYKDLPTNLHGDFYNQHLTFFLLPKNDLRNIKLVLNRCNINVERIILKSFLKGIYKINKDNKKNNFSIIHIGKNKCNISIFKNSSFVFFQKFSFGSKIIFKDVAKLCSLNITVVEKIFDNICIDEVDPQKNKFLDQKYFTEGAVRKISLEHLSEISRYRIEEIISLIYKKNINLKSFTKDINQIYLSFEDTSVYHNLKKTFKNQFSKPVNVVTEVIDKEENLHSCIAAAELVGKGWEKEAIPTIYGKKSKISRFFKAIFN